MPSAAEAAAFANPESWDDRYSKAADGEKPTYEWYLDFQSLEPYFSKHLFTTRKPESQPRILHLGNGDSTVPVDLLKRGYANQICLDFSAVVVQLMKERHGDEGVEWTEGDVRDMKDVASGSIDVAFDKGTLDAMIYGSSWSLPEEVMVNTGKYMNEVQRVLKSDGIFLNITFRQPKFVKPILNRNNEWDLEMESLGGGGSLEYFGFVLRKHPSDEATAPAAQ